jgi:hypothetical protein
MRTSEIPSAGPWKTHVASDGSGIGGVDPKTYGFTVVPSKKPSVLMASAGTTKPGGYPAWMLYPASPVPIQSLASVITAELSFSIWVDQLTAAAANVIETDTIFIFKGADGKTEHYNGSAQLVLGSNGWALEVGTGTGGWQKTGAVIPALAPNVKHKIKIAYTLDTVKHTVSVTSYTVDGATYLVPPANQLQPTTPTTWALGAYLQLQQGLLPAGNPCTWRFASIKYRIC